MRYEIKVSDINTPNVTKKTISFFSGSKEARKVKSDIAFDAKVNGGLGTLTLALNEEFKTSEIGMGDIIKIRNFTDTNKMGVDVYYGYVETLERVIEERGQSVVLSCQGIAYLLRDVIYQQATIIVNNLADPSATVTDILTRFNANYPVPLITIGTYPLFGAIYDLTFDSKSSLEAINIIIGITDWVFFVGADGVFNMKPKTPTVDNILVFQKQITKISLGNEREDITNKLHSVTTSPQGLTLYEDVVSQGVYGIKEKRIDELAIGSNTSQDDYGNNFIADNANPKQRLKLELNITADFNTLIPGNLIRVKNIDATIADARIVRTTFSSTKFTIDCEKTETLGEAIINS